MNQQIQPPPNAPMAPAPVANASAANSNAPVVQQQNQNQLGQVPVLAPQAPMPPHLLPFANTTMAAGNPLFPPPVMLSNGTFLAMPEMFAPQGNAAAQANMMPRMAAVIGSQPPFNVVPDATQQQNGQVAPAAPQQMNAPANSQLQVPAMTQPLAAAPRPDRKSTVSAAPTPSTLGGVPIPALPPHSTTAMQVQVAAAAAAAAAAPLKTSQTITKAGKKDGSHDGRNGKSGGRVRRSDLTPEEKAKQNRDRNREHARSTRLRKKAYVQKLKELVDGLHAERTEEVRKRRVAVQHLAEVQNVRRAVVRTFLGFHSSFESDPRKWMTILEDAFWFKQPVTPYRSFRRVEIEQECRVSRGIDAMIADAASVSVMVEGIGSRSTRWMLIKRENLLLSKEGRGASNGMPNVVNPNTRFQHAVSSLSSSSGSSNGSGTEEERRSSGLKRPATDITKGQSNGMSGAGGATQADKVSTSSTSSGSMKPSNEYHDYHAPSLPDPMLDSGGSSHGSDSPAESQKGSNGANTTGTRDATTDSSSGDEDAMNGGPAKKAKLGINLQMTGVSAGTQSLLHQGTLGAAPVRQGLPPNIAKSGGISHNIQPHLAVGKTSNPRLSSAPATALPPFLGIGKRVAIPSVATATATVGAALTSPHHPTAGGAISTVTASTVAPTAAAIPAAANVSRASTESIRAPAAPTSITSSAPMVTDETASNSSNQTPQIQAYYHVNEDDMLLTEDVLMCPFIFRSQDAVMCGALAECIMPGMLRAHFSARNKLMSLEMVYDSMGFMQQLERASGTEGTAQIVPSSLEMALSPNTTEARVITLAKAPYRIVSVNEAFTRITRYTQMEVEGKEMSILNGKRTDPEAGARSGKPPHKFEEVAQGRCGCSVNFHYCKGGKEFVDFMCSYPLTNANDEVTHLLHVCKELPEPSSPIHDFPES